MMAGDSRAASVIVHDRQFCHNSPPLGPVAEIVGKDRPLKCSFSLSDTISFKRYFIDKKLRETYDRYFSSWSATSLSVNSLLSLSRSSNHAKYRTSAAPSRRCDCLKPADRAC